MRTYKDYTYSQEFDVTCYLVLVDDGQFTYSESYLSYGGGFDAEVRGSWRQSGDTVFLRAEHVEDGMNRYTWVEGRERRAVLQPEDESIKFEGGAALHLQRDEPIQPAPRVQAKEETAAAAKQKEKPIPTVARLRFKDGSVQERPLPNDPLFGLFDKMFYRLVDENGNVTNVFELRWDSRNPDGTIAEYDEIDYTPSAAVDAADATEA